MEKDQSRERITSKRNVKRKKRVERLHSHEHHELYYMLEGKTTYFIDGNFYDVEKGDIVFVPKGTIHDTNYEKGRHSERILLIVKEEYLEGKGARLKDFLLSMRVVHIPPDKLREIEEIIEKITKEDRQMNEYKEVILESYIRILLTLISRCHNDQDLKICENNKIIGEIADYIKEHYDENLSLKSISTMFALNESYLSRRFKDIIGIGLTKYITMVRIDNAARLLLESDLSVTDIAEQCGFSDSNYFASVFKKAKGIAPMHYKKQDGWGAK